MEIKCKSCNKKPEEIEEYLFLAKEEDITPEEYVIDQEGTFNNRTGAFFCTSCYIKEGMPLGTA